MTSLIKVLLLVGLLLLAPACNSTPKPGPTSPTRTTVNEFINSIRHPHAAALRELVSPSGLVLIRNFVSGTYGARGKNFRAHFDKERLPSNLEIPVPEEDPIRISEMFPGSGEGKSPVLLEVYGFRFGFKDSGKENTRTPSTTEVIDILAKILEKQKTNDFEPKLFKMEEQEMALVEMNLVQGMPIGTAAVFEKQDSKYYLRALIDLR